MNFAGLIRRSTTIGSWTTQLTNRLFSSASASIPVDSPPKPHKKLKAPSKRAAHLLLQLNDEQIKKFHLEIPEFKAGDSVELKWLNDVTTGSFMTYKGVVLARVNRGLGSNFLIRNHLGGTAFEIRFPLYSPLLQEFKVLQKAFIHKGKKRVRKSKLYYLRDKPPKLTTVN